MKLELKQLGEQNRETLDNGKHSFCSNHLRGSPYLGLLTSTELLPAACSYSQQQSHCGESCSSSLLPEATSRSVCKYTQLHASYTSPLHLFPVANTSA